LRKKRKSDIARPHNSPKNEFNRNWEGSLTFEKVNRYLIYLKSAVQVPIYLIGIDS
jgi:hypothetical protein